MSAAEFDSGIDDSGPSLYSANHVPRYHQALAQNSKPVTNEQLPLHGPRLGHWTVSSSVNGSAIDNDCPTVHNLNFDCDVLGDRQGYVSARCVQPIALDLLVKLREATIAEQKKKEVPLREVGSALDVASSKTSQPDSTTTPIVLSRLLVLPITSSPGIRITDKNGNTLVVREPTSLARVIKPTSRRKRAPQDSPKELCEPTNRSQSLAKSSQSTLHIAGWRAPRLVRISGKNGEELVTELPPNLTSPSSRSPPVYAPAGTIQKEIDAQRKREQLRATNAASQLRQQREAMAIETKKLDVEREPDAMCSAALPASYVARNTSKRATDVLTSDAAAAYPAPPRSSPRNSHNIYDNDAIQSSTSSDSSSTTISKVASNRSFNEMPRPPSKASSRTSTYSSARKGSQTPPRSTHSVVSEDSWQEWKEHFVHGSHTNTKSKSNATRSSYSSDRWNDWDTTTWKKIETLTSTSAPRTKAEGRNVSVSTTTLEHDFGHSISIYQPKEDSQLRFGLANDSQPTIYAGQGWISPHPLSVASVAHQDPPEPAIYIPSRSGSFEDGRVLTFEEWNAFRQSSPREEQDIRKRRNVSHTNSEVQSQVRGQWGRKGSPASWAHGEHSRKRRDLSNYRQPIVTTEEEELRIRSPHRASSSWQDLQQVARTPSALSYIPEEGGGNHISTGQSESNWADDYQEDIERSARDEWKSAGQSWSVASHQRAESASSWLEPRLDPFFYRPKKHLRMPWDEK